MGRMAGERAAADGYDAWLAAALLEAQRRVWSRRARPGLRRVPTNPAAEVRPEAVIDADACEAWLASG